MMPPIDLKQALRNTEKSGTLSSLIRKMFRITFRSLVAMRLLLPSSSSSGIEISPPRKRNNDEESLSRESFEEARLSGLENAGWRGRNVSGPKALFAANVVVAVAAVAPMEFQTAPVTITKRNATSRVFGVDTVIVSSIDSAIRSL